MARTEGATHYVIRLATFVALLAAETGKPDVVIGTYVTNRNRVAMQNMFGFFANLATLRFRCDPKLTFRDWVSVVQGRVVETEAHCEIPYDELRKEVQGQGMNFPEIRAIFSVSHHHATMHFGGLELAPRDQLIERMPWGFSMNFDQHNEEHNCMVAFDAGIYDPAGVRGLIKRFGRLLDVVSRHPGLPINELLAMTGGHSAMKIYCAN